MSELNLSARTIRFVNIAHAIDHFVLLIFPTAVLAMAAQGRYSYAELIGLSTGAFVAFGLFSLPAGWMADRLGRRNMLAGFFLGVGACCLGLAIATSLTQFAVLLFILGSFAAIYHPVGLAMLVSHTHQLGRDLGVNGVWGNLGAAMAAAITAGLLTLGGWQLAFAVPGAIAIAIGGFFLISVPGDGNSVANTRKKGAAIHVSRPFALLSVVVIAIIAGGFTFNITTIALPKILDERLGFDLPLPLIGALATSVFLLGALTQLVVGRLIDRITLPVMFVVMAVLQAAGLALASQFTGIMLLIGLTLTMAAIYGQVIVNDGMVARYIPGRYQARAFGIRYFIGFTTAGAAVPLLAILHQQNGFSTVLLAACGFGMTIALMALAFFTITRSSAAQPAIATNR